MNQGGQMRELWEGKLEELCSGLDVASDEAERVMVGLSF